MRIDRESQVIQFQPDLDAWEPMHPMIPTQLGAMQEDVFRSEVADGIDFDSDYSGKTVAALLMNAHQRGMEDGRRQIMLANGHGTVELPEGAEELTL